MSTAFPDPRYHLTELLRDAQRAVAPDSTSVAVVLERPKSAQHGDYSCNLAMQLAKAMKRNPREIARALVDALPASPMLEKSEIAGAGFINLYLKPAAKQQAISQVLARGADFGRAQSGNGRKVQVEFVSANPTGPLHVGHGRGAAYGASLSNLLDIAGFAVSREYYVNDAGRQMDILCVSVWMRYLEQLGESLPFPSNGYQGDYVRARAHELRESVGERMRRSSREVLEGLPEAPTGDEDAAELRMDALIERSRALLAGDFEVLTKQVLDRQVAEIRDVLTRFRVTFDRWYSERSLYESGLVAEALKTLDAAGHLYTKDGARWFRSTAFGDDKDRVVQRENGLYTYFASDIAYHHDKLKRGFDILIDVWGADHHGYIPRVKAAISALGRDPDRLEVPLIQLVALFRGGEQVRMGKRSGSFVTLEELFDEVGVDATRYFYLARKSDQHLDFDLDLAKSRSNENPVYYIQYAHARVCSVLEQWGGDASRLVNADLAPLVEEQELLVMQKLLDYPEQIESAAKDLAPHQVAFYLKDLAALFHSYYNATRFLVDEENVRLARLALAAAVRQVLRNGLAILGVGAPEKM
ncbi:MAG TPA: arginine--tRNA ligase [Burkholderiales bacterium]|nr:arginine--tRNA ligase [Burkholderiales bacterium]